MKNRKLILKISMPIVAVVCTMVFVPLGLVKAQTAPTVQIELEKAVAQGMDGIIIHVNKPEESTSYAAGWKNRADKIPADPHALFKIGSISKLYVAVAVAKLVDKQSLSLDASLAELLPELADRIKNADSVTLRLLVQHRSGIPNFTDYPDFWGNIPESSEEMLALVLDKPADFAPDEKYNYSNTNYLLLGKILDRTLGYSHHQYIKKEILIPLKLNDTYSLLSEVNLEEVASGYYVGYEEDMKPNDYVDASGSMVATAQDVGVFLRALNDGSLLNENEQAIYSSIYTYKHSGWVIGYQSIARYHKDLDAVVVQFINTCGANTIVKSEMLYDSIIRALRKQEKGE